MEITDQPGRILAVTVIAPVICIMGYILLHCNKYNFVIGKTLLYFGVVFFIYECFWITRATKHACI